MGLNTLNNRSSGETITANFFNDVHQAMNGDFVGRNSSGVPTASQNLGTAGVPWGTLRASSLILNGNAVDTSSIVAPANRVVSGKTRATAGSNLPMYLVPDGAALEADLDASPTNLVVVINGSTVTFSTDATKTGLTAAPTVNNTALVNDTAAADQFDTKYWGESNHRKSIIIDTVGSEISALVGKWAAFKIAGVTDEYFLAYVKSATELSNCWRGFFYDSSLAPIKPTGFSNNDTITLMKLTWWFAENDGSTIDVSYNNPTWSFTSPSSPVTGDYWYNLSTSQWNRYNGSTFQVINRTFIGWTIQDGTACVGARCVDFYADFSADNTLKVEEATNEIVRAIDAEATVSVAGTEINFGHDRPTWNITTDLAASSDMFDATEQASRLYWLYLKQNGDTVISDISPFIRPDLKGRYHRYNMWRCVGWFYNDASSDIQGAANWNYDGGQFSASTGNGFGSTFTKTRRWSTVEENTLSGIEYTDSATDGARFTVLVDGGIWGWDTDFNGTNPSFHGWVHNINAVVYNPTDRTIDKRNVYTQSTTGSPQPCFVSSVVKVGDTVNVQCDNGSETDGTAQVDVILRWIPGKEI